MSVDLPAPDGPTRNTKSPSGMTRSTSRSASLPLGYCLVTSCRTRTARSRPAWSRCRPRSVRRLRRERPGVANRGERSRVSPRSDSMRTLPPPTLVRFDSVRGHGKGSHVEPEATTGRLRTGVRGDTDGRRGVRAGPARSAGSATEVARTAGPSTAARGTARGGARRPAPPRRRGPRCQAARSRSAPRGWSAPQEVAHDRCEEVRIPDGDRTDATELARIPVAQHVAVGADVQPAAAALRAQEAVVDRVRDAEQLAVEVVDGIGQAAVALSVPIGGPATSSSKDTARTPVGSSPKRREARRQSRRG